VLPPVNPALAPAQANLERGRALLNSGNAADAIKRFRRQCHPIRSCTKHTAFSVSLMKPKGMRERAFERLRKLSKQTNRNAEYLK
jgi:hypothetical protein